MDFSAINAKRAKSAAKKEKRAEKAKSLWRPKVKRKKLPSLPKLKTILWDKISLVVRSWSPICVACRVNPTYSANHIVPSNDGAATRFFLPNIYPGCSSCNEAERRRRGQWVKRHEEIFGVDFVDALYAMSKEIFPLKRWWLNEQIARMDALLNLEAFNAQQLSPSPDGGIASPLTPELPTPNPPG